MLRGAVRSTLDRENSVKYLALNVCFCRGCETGMEKWDLVTCVAGCGGAICPSAESEGPKNSIGAGRLQN